MWAFTYMTTCVFWGYGYFTDLLTRLSVNEALLGTYYFWWTSLTYVPLFFFSLSTLYVLTSPSLRARVAVLTSLPLFTLYLTEFIDYHPLNQSWSVTDATLSGVNILLTNALNRYHPFVFYTSAALLLLTLLCLINVTYSNRSRRAAPQSPVPVFGLSQSAVINIVALWMGSWWALQEGTWGGWWNWDSSETFGLMILLAVLYLWHARVLSRSPFTAVATTLIFVAAIVLSYFFIQLNFDLVSHNFGSKFFFFFNNNLFFLEVSTVLLLLIGVWSSRSLTLLHQVRMYRAHIVHSQVAVSPILRQAPFWVPLFWVIISYKPLLNYFVWNFLALNLFNFEISLQAVNLVALIALTVWLPSAAFLSKSLLVAYSIKTVNWFWALGILLLSRSSLHSFHILLVWFTLTNLAVAELSLSSWLVESNYSYFQLSTSLFEMTSKLFSVDTVGFEVADNWATPYSALIPSWNLVAVSNSPSVNFFTLLFTNDALSNLYSLVTLYATSYLTLELPYLTALNSLAVASLFFLIVLKRTHYKLNHF